MVVFYNVSGSIFNSHSKMVFVMISLFDACMIDIRLRFKVFFSLQNSMARFLWRIECVTGLHGSMLSLARPKRTALGTSSPLILGRKHLSIFLKYLFFIFDVFVFDVIVKLFFDVSVSKLIFAPVAFWPFFSHFRIMTGSQCGHLVHESRHLLGRHGRSQSFAFEKWITLDPQM